MWTKLSYSQTRSPKMRNFWGVDGIAATTKKKNISRAVFFRKKQTRQIFVERVSDYVCVEAEKRNTITEKCTRKTTDTNKIIIS